MLPYYQNRKDWNNKILNAQISISSSLSHLLLKLINFMIIHIYSADIR